MGNIKLCVIMSTYNGEKYLREQIESIICQKDIHVITYVRDDGSTDRTIDILKTYCGKDFFFVAGKNCGAKTSFLKALYTAPTADYYAFADQDDVWDEDKLICAVKAIKNVEKDYPNKEVLYSGRTRLVDEKLNVLINQNKHKPTISLVSGFLKGQTNNSAGCTMVFNRALKNIISTYSPTIFPMHDVWVKEVCLAIGGKVIYDSNPHMSYRQHATNTVGGKRNILQSLIRRIKFYRKMGKQYHSKMLKEIFDNYNSIMPVENIQRYKFVISYSLCFSNKLALLKDRDFFRGNLKYRIEMFGLVLFGWY